MFQIHEKIGTGEGVANCCLNIWMGTFFSERIKGTSLYLLLNLCLSRGVGLSNPICLPLSSSPYLPSSHCICAVLGGNYSVSVLISKCPRIRPSEWRMNEHAIPPGAIRHIQPPYLINKQEDISLLGPSSLLPAPFSSFPPPPLLSSISISRASIMSGIQILKLRKTRINKTKIWPQGNPYGYCRLWAIKAESSLV